MPSYHALHVETSDISKTSIFDLPFGYQVVCTRTGGWELLKDGRPVAGEYYKQGLRLTCDGKVLVDSLTEKQAEAAAKGA